ncbi:MAG: hypothetical protein ACYS47_07350, partial [Planctomycetota bacterium]|jgi:hypothetical protein
MGRAILGALLLTALFCSTQVLAQSEDEPKLTWEQRMRLQRMKWELKLSDEQMEKVRALLVKEGNRTRKGILEFLDADQKEAFEEMEKSPRWGRTPGGHGEGGPGGFSRSFNILGGGKGGPYGMTVKELKKEVPISEDEASQIEKIFEKYREERKEGMKKLMEDFDFGNIGKIVGGDEKLDKKTLKKVRKALAEERREAFDAYAEKRKKKKRFPGSVRVFGPGGGDLDLEGLGDLGKSLKDSLKGLKKHLKDVPDAAKEVLSGRPSLDRICKEAGFEGIEGEVLREKVKGILEAKKAYGKFLSDSKKALKDAANEGEEEAIRSGLDTHRTKRAEWKENLSALKEDLRSLLTYEQEAKLVALGVLD